jgi:hypothetical protein
MERKKVYFEICWTGYNMFVYFLFICFLTEPGMRVLLLPATICPR